MNIKSASFHFYNMPDPVVLASGPTPESTSDWICRHYAYTAGDSGMDFSLDITMIAGKGLKDRIVVSLEVLPDLASVPQSANQTLFGRATELEGRYEIFMDSLVREQEDYWDCYQTSSLIEREGGVEISGGAAAEDRIKQMLAVKDFLGERLDERLSACRISNILGKKYPGAGVMMIDLFTDYKTQSFDAGYRRGFQLVV